MSVTKVSSAMQDLTDDYAFTGTISGAGAPSHRNDIINGGLVVNQENVTAPADADFTIGDLFLHNGEGTPVMSLETDGPQGTRPWQKMVLDANDQGGLAYIVPNATVQDYIANGKMSFGIQLKTTAATIANARIGILKWTGTADAVTKELVGTWASDGTSPTLATSLSYENTPANLGLTTSWARHVVEDVTVDADTTNIVIFVWTDDGTITASDVIGFSEWQLNPGATVNAFSQPDLATTKAQVKHFVEVLNEEGAASYTFCPMWANTTTISTAIITYEPKFKPPVGSSMSATVAHYRFRRYDDTAYAGASTAITYNSPGTSSSNVQMTTSGLTVGWVGYFAPANVAGKILFDARIGI
jgi:hypothetical protein